MSSEKDPPDRLLCPMCSELFINPLTAPCCAGVTCRACVKEQLLEDGRDQCWFLSCMKVGLEYIDLYPNKKMRLEVEAWSRRKEKDNQRRKRRRRRKSNHNMLKEEMKPEPEANEKKKRKKNKPFKNIQVPKKNRIVKKVEAPEIIQISDSDDDDCTSCGAFSV